MAKRKQKLSYTSKSKKKKPDTDIEEDVVVGTVKTKLKFSKTVHRLHFKEIDKSNDVSITLQNDSRKEYRLRKCTFCLDAQRTHIFERDAVYSSFILKKGLKVMKENWYNRKSFINDSISSVWSTFKNELV
eukprot:NODE_71_length_23666_cov_0.239403.p12 type:complete len:131 gc:universal NODE_71_length_23666_cov_0.239403:8578-8970(+)